jgi:hypothetical protein
VEIIAKFVDYSLYAIDFFINEIKENLSLRDIPGLTNDKVDKINISKEHPIVSLFASSLKDNRTEDKLFASLIPGIGVTPAGISGDGKTLGDSLKNIEITSDILDKFKNFDSQKDREQEGQITEKIINDIEYKIKRNERILAQTHQCRKNEEINISLWCDFPDSDILFSIMVESILKDIQTGFAGDGSKVKNMDIKTIRGLTNFKFGRVLYGTEFSVTFLNTYTNYTVFTDPKITDVDYDLTFETVGEENET